MATRHRLHRSNSFRYQKQEMDRKMMFEQDRSNKTLSGIEREKQALLQDLQGINTRSSSFRDSPGHYNYAQPSTGDETVCPCSYSRNMYGSFQTATSNNMDSREEMNSRERASSFSPASLPRRDFSLQRPNSYSPTLLRKSAHGSSEEGSHHKLYRHSDPLQSRSHPVSAELKRPTPSPCKSQPLVGGQSPSYNSLELYHHPSLSSPVSHRRATLLRKAEQLEGDIIRRQTDRGGFMYGETNGERWEQIKISKYHAGVRKPVAAFATHKQHSKASP